MKAVCFACGQRKIKFATKRESREPLGRAVVRRSEVFVFFVQKPCVFLMEGASAGFVMFVHQRDFGDLAGGDKLQGFQVFGTLC